MRKQAGWVAAGACLLMLAASCGNGPPPRPRTHAPAKPAAATGLAAGGTLSLASARTGYDAQVVPAYGDAVRLAGDVLHSPARVSADFGALAKRLRAVTASLHKVAGFPGRTGPAFAAFQRETATVLADFASPGKVVASRRAKHHAASDLFTLARRIGQLGVALGLMPTTETGRGH
jgi:hypothetical protein